MNNEKMKSKIKLSNNSSFVILIFLILKFWVSQNLERNLEMSQLQILKYRKMSYSIILFSNLIYHFLEIIWIPKIFNNFKIIKYSFSKFFYFPNC